MLGETRNRKGPVRKDQRLARWQVRKGVHENVMIAPEAVRPGERWPE
jgi:hypothetical protein